MRRMVGWLALSVAIAATTGCPNPSMQPPLPETGKFTPKPLAKAVLTGLVRVPPAVLAGIQGIGNRNGALVIANNGAQYRTQAAAQQPLAGATVRLVDARGQALKGADGQALTATTDAAGRYELAALPAAARNAVVRVELPDGRGALTALLPKDRPAGVDLDAASTLATTYILETFAKPQADPQAAFDRLPADLAAGTSAAAGAALEAGTTFVERLDATSVVAAVDALRGRDAALEAKLKEVRARMILAGQADGGAGQPALDVALGDVTGVGYAPDGSLLVLAPDDKRLYKVDAAGVLRVVAGTGEAARADQSGKPAAEAALGYLDEAILLPDGGLVLVDHIDRLARVMRVAPDGTLTEAWRKESREGYPLPAIGAAALLPGGEVALFVDLNFDTEVWKLPAGSGAPSRVAELAGLATSWMSDAGATADGKQVLITASSLGARGAGTFALDLPGFTGGGAAIGTEDGTIFDLAGRAFQVTSGTWALAQLAGDGKTTAVALAAPEGAGAPYLRSATLDPQGRAVYAHDRAVWRVEGGKAVRLAGGGKARAGDQAKAGAFAAPQALAPDGEGGWYVADEARVLRIDGAGTVSVVAQGLAEPPKRLARGADGKLLALVGGKLVAPGGDEVLAPAAGKFEDLLVAPNGDWLLAETAGDRVTLTRRAAGGAPTTLASYGSNHLAIAAAADGTVWYTMTEGPEYPHLYGAMRLVRVPAGGGAPETVGEDKRFGQVYEGGMAVDAKGRLIFVSRPDVDVAATIQRYDPASKAFTVLAGPGGRRFAGTAGDDSIEEPFGLQLTAAGDLVFVDRARRQLRTIPAADLVD